MPLAFMVTGFFKSAPISKIYPGAGFPDALRSQIEQLFGQQVFHVAGRAGKELLLREGMRVTAFEPDVGDDGRPDHLLASGTVIPSPVWLACKGSRWALRIDERGVHHESDLR